MGNVSLLVASTGLIFGLFGFWLGWSLRSPNQKMRVDGDGNCVDQRNVISSGDVVGGDLIKSKEGGCEYCGAK